MFSKSKNLIRINSKIKKKDFIIPKFFIVHQKDFKKYEYIIFKIHKIFFGKKIIIRSSSKNEDKIKKSNAGKYDSLIIDKFDKKKIINGIKFVSKKLINAKDEIIIQELINNTDISGVIFSKDINNESPYFIINYDTSGKTNLITSGKKNSSMKTLVVYDEKNIKGIFNKIIEIVKKFEKIFEDSILDVEFAVKKKKIYIFQCRNLKKFRSDNRNKINENLINLEKKIRKLKKENPYLQGKTSYFSNMSDWNPAEMIGNKPKPLAISLYKELITNSVWAKQRSDYGYKDVRPNHLLINLVGSPYIDLRTDLNSFMPAKLDLKIQKKLVNHFLNKLKENKHFHDKIEFEIIPTVFEADIYKKIKNVLTTKEEKKYINHLRDITNFFFNNNNEILNKELKKINILEKRILNIKRSKLSEIQKIYFLLEECKQNGTLPFAGLARCAFVANSIIKSFIDEKILTKEEKLNFYESFFNISNLINQGLININKPLRKKEFFKRFGHLRPLTYSISSKNYEENFNIYFKNFATKKKVRRKKFDLSKINEKKINNFFKKNKINTDAKKFFYFAKKSTQYREYSKLVFTKSINEIFLNLIKLGKEININRYDLEFLTINKLIESYSNLSNSKLKKIFKKEILENKRNHKILFQIKMPDFIENHENIYMHEAINAKGNYITEKNTSGKIFKLNFKKKSIKINNKIVFIENADPGYDFIFSHNLKGLVTKYGGPNSHMAIRCMELGIPAVIGIGENRYNSLLDSNFIELNCSLKRVDIIN